MTVLCSLACNTCYGFCFLCIPFALIWWSCMFWCNLECRFYTGNQMVST